MMVQWHDLKKQGKDALLLFRLGDFYEAFYSDAELISKELDLTLTQRNGVPMSGVPFHTLETYLDRLIARGYKVAIAEQMEDPLLTKGIVKREIVRMVTPGTIINSNLLSEKKNNFLIGITEINTVFGFALLDLTTATFRLLELQSEDQLLDELAKLQPSELLVSEKCYRHRPKLFEEIRLIQNVTLTIKEEWQFDHKTSLDVLLRQFRVHNLDGFGLQGMVAAINAAGALLTYVREELCLSLDHIQTLRADTLTSYMQIDRTTQKNLELTASLIDGSEKNTLLSLLDQTATPMGARLLKEWIAYPLLCKEKIDARLSALEAFILHAELFLQLKKHLKLVRDLERLIGRIATGYASPKDLLALNDSLKQIPPLREQLSFISSPLISHLTQKLKCLKEVTEKIDSALVETPPFRVGDGPLFKTGYCKELDELIKIKTGSTQWLANYQAELREETGIKTLKIGYTKAFGYSIEVSRIQSHKMPAHFDRKQTLINAERYISPELKEYEHKVLTAEEQINVLEAKLFSELKTFIATFNCEIKENAESIAHLDVLFSLAQVSMYRRYVRPTIDTSRRFVIKQARHPIIEASLSDNAFIPNDISFGSDEEQLLLITGPNMAGKSTYLRQAALIAIMAQIGCFVPASSAEIGIIDKVFSRIGASDDLSRGKSTFMVEMSETANILNNATSHSLIILDEIGRGTSTYDGISIAWAVVDYLLTTPEKRAKTLFATHYWELTQLEKQLPGIVNYHVAVHEADEEIIFLHKINQGETDKSYGIHVARLAGLPPSVIRRAIDILAKMEKHSARPARAKPVQKQLFLFPTSTPDEEGKLEKIAADLKKLDLNHFTPVQALQKLSEYQSMIYDIRS
jgi:DNA mismatch repair protein MutS